MKPATARFYVEQFDRLAREPFLESYRAKVLFDLAARVIESMLAERTRLVKRGRPRC